MCICLSGVVIDSAFSSGERYFSLALLVGCPYVIRERELKSLIVDDLEKSSDENVSHRNDSLLRVRKRTKWSRVRVLLQSLTILLLMMMILLMK